MSDLRQRSLSRAGAATPGCKMCADVSGSAPARTLSERVGDETSSSVGSRRRIEHEGPASLPRVSRRRLGKRREPRHQSRQSVLLLTLKDRVPVRAIGVRLRMYETGVREDAEGIDDGGWKGHGADSPDRDPCLVAWDKRIRQADPHFT